MPDRDLFANFDRMRREMDELFGDVFERTRSLAPPRRVLATGRRRLHLRPAAGDRHRRAGGCRDRWARPRDPGPQADPLRTPRSRRGGRGLPAGRDRARRLSPDRRARRRRPGRAREGQLRGRDAARRAAAGSQPDPLDTRSRSSRQRSLRVIEIGAPSRGPRDVEVSGTPQVPQSVGVLPLRDTVTFPDMLIPLNVGQQRSIELINDVLRGDRSIVMVASRNPEVEAPGPEDLYSVGVLGVVARMISVPDGTLRVLIQGGQRVRIDAWLADRPVPGGADHRAARRARPDAGAGGADAQRPADVHRHRRAGPVPARGAADDGRQRRGPEHAGAPDRRARCG